jgi:hypothetical protein
MLAAQQTITGGVNEGRLMRSSPLDVFEAGGGEPWHVIRAAWVGLMSEHFLSLGQEPAVDEFMAFHESCVKSALDKGKPVSAEVLADYPGMKAETPEEHAIRLKEAEEMLRVFFSVM